MPRIFILADDLSGAADSGIACVVSGLRTTVVLEPGIGDCDVDVLSLDADTRSMNAEEAAREVARWTERQAARSDLLIFKKVDSTLRGNVAAELAAALGAYRRVRGAGAISIMAPAFPAIGRTTVDGVQLAHGEPLHHLDIWRIQGMSGLASIPQMLEGARLRSRLLRIESIRSGPQALAEEMMSLGRQADVLVCDAKTDNDLKAIADASMQLDPKPIWAGSAGLIYQLPLAAGLATGAHREPLAPPECLGPLLFVIGSLSRNSIEQLRLLTSSGQEVGIRMRPDVLLAGEGSALWNEYGHQLEGAIRSGQDAVLSLEPGPLMDLACRPRLAAALGRMAASVSSEVGALIASGGETARAVLNCWGVRRLELLGELERGIPVAVTEGWSRPMPVITKAGDFGRADTLLKCAQVLHSARSNQMHLHNTRKVTE